MDPVAVAILAGGRATRLGGAVKPLIEVAGRTILARQREALSDWPAERFLVANDPVPFQNTGLRIVADSQSGQGPLRGIETALIHGDTDSVLVIAGDLPLLAPALLRLIANHAPGALAVIPLTARGPEPLVARYSRSLLPEIQSRLGAGRLAVRELAMLSGVVLIEELALRGVDPGLCSFDNVNTPEDLARVTARALANTAAPTE